MFTCTLSPSLHMCGGSTMLRSGPTCMALSMYCVLTTWPPMWCACSEASLFIGVLQRNTVNVTSPFRMSKSHVITHPLWGTCSNTYAWTDVDMYTSWQIADTFTELYINLSVLLFKEWLTAFHYQNVNINIRL